MDSNMAQLQDKQIKKKGDVTFRNVVDSVEANGYYATGNSARVLDFELKQCYGSSKRLLCLFV